ncbi:replication protein [Lutispora sp.]|uniref:replication protein n=1 Tax=Lutispora sp. TaxID=2828727 RepID=UPI0035629536
MASPQLENGYVRIANDLIEALARAKLNGTQRRILDVIIRNTYGYNKKTASLSDSFISKATGIHQKQVNREVNNLIDIFIVHLEYKGDYNNPRKIGLNKNFEKWRGNENITCNEKVTTNELVDKSSNGNVEKVPTNPLPKKDILKTDIKTNEYEDFFELIWNLYPKKKGKGQVSDTQKKKLYKIGIEEITKAIERCKKEKTETDLKYWQNGSTFFNSGYVDYLDSNYEEQTKVEGDSQPTDWRWKR